MQCKSISTRIGESLLELGAIPVHKRGPDWRIACGLVKEAQGYLHVRNTKQAESMLKSALPNIEAAKRDAGV